MEIQPGLFANTISFRFSEQEKKKHRRRCEQFMDELKAQLPPLRRSYDLTSDFWTVSTDDYESVVKALKRKYLFDQS